MKEDPCPCVAILTPNSSEADQLRASLRESGIRSEHFAAPARLLSALRLTRFDAVIVDWDEAGADRIALLTNLRVRMRLKLPILVSTRTTDSAVDEALRAGANDFIVTPTSGPNLATRLRVSMVQFPLLASRKQCTAIRLSATDLSVTLSRRRVRLTPREFGVFSVLHRYMGSTVPREYILDDVWGDRDASTARRVDIHVSRIRNKLFTGTSSQWKIDNLPNLGYRLIPRLTSSGTKRTAAPVSSIT